MAAREAKIDEARQRMYVEVILGAAEAEFAAHGFDATGMREIARRAGVSVKTVYDFYRSKLELYQAVGIARGAGLLAAVVEALASVRSESALDRLLAALTAYIGYAFEHPDYARLLLREGPLSPDPSERRAAEQDRQWARGLEASLSLIETGIENGELVPCEPQDLLAMMMNLLQIRLAAWLQHPDRWTRDSLIERARAELIRLACPPTVAADRLDETGLVLRR
ncbi:MAG: TetR/AcrR family transcriptional regulator [Candidatus Dadabacteria bacterium]|nr:MAG: TetR/AcrR family transcriptional regulator [Candidatus Dadabacteria bacterium]